MSDVDYTRRQVILFLAICAILGVFGYRAYDRAACKFYEGKSW